MEDSCSFRSRRILNSAGSSSSEIPSSLSKVVSGIRFLVIGLSLRPEKFIFVNIYILTKSDRSERTKCSRTGSTTVKVHHQTS